MCVFPPSPAVWIWLDPVRFAEYQVTPPTFFSDRSTCRFAMAGFRKSWEWREKPVAVELHHTGDVFYRFRINGRYAGSGPVEVGGDFLTAAPPDWWYAEVLDVTGFFQAGINTVEVEVGTLPIVQTHYSQGNPGLRMEFRCRFADGSSVTVGTDASWEGTLLPAFQEPCHYNANLEPAAWFPAAARPECERELRASGIPPLREFPVYAVRVEAPHLLPERWEGDPAQLTRPEGGKVRLKAGAPASFSLFFDREVVGMLELRVSGASGMALFFDYAELPGVEHHREVYVLKDGDQEFRSIRLNAVQVLRVTVHFGSWVANTRSDLVIEQLRVMFASHPTERIGRVAASEPFYAELFDCCAWTLQLCRQRLELDSPVHQEGLGCTGDYLIESMFNYYVTGDSRLTRLDLERTALALKQQDGVMFHTSYSLLWVQMLWDYREFTGDLELIRAVYPQLQRLLARFDGYCGVNGLVSEAPNYMFIDWIYHHGHAMHHPPAQLGMGAMTAFFANALARGAQLAELLGEPGDADSWRRRWLELRDAFQRELYVPERGLYRDGIPFLTKVAPNAWLPADNIPEITYSSQTNVLAVAFDLAPEELRQPVLRRVMTESGLTAMQPYFYYFVFDALDRAGLTAEFAHRTIMRWQPVIAEHPGSLAEAWTTGDYSHAWGVAPAIAMARRLLGVTPAVPGGGEWRIRPCLPPELEWLEGTFPTPQGEMTLRIGRDGVRIDLPPGTKGTLEWGTKRIPLTGGVTEVD